MCKTQEWDLLETFWVQLPEAKVPTTLWSYVWCSLRFLTGYCKATTVIFFPIWASSDVIILHYIDNFIAETWFEIFLDSSKWYH